MLESCQLKRTRSLAVKQDHEGQQVSDVQALGGGVEPAVEALLGPGQVAGQVGRNLRVDVEQQPSVGQVEHVLGRNFRFRRVECGAFWACEQYFSGVEFRQVSVDQRVRKQTVHFK